MPRWAALAALSWLASGGLYLTLPPSPDQFQHAYLGWRLAEGDVAYRDIVDPNWPGVMGLHALAVALFGVNWWSWRALDFLLFSASALFLADLVRESTGRSAARLCLIICPPAYAGASYWLTGQHDMSAAQFLVPALWFHHRAYQRGGLRDQAGAGACIALAMLSKPTVGILGLLLPLQALWTRRPPYQVAAHTAVAGVAAVATLVAASGAVVASGTSWRELADATLVYNAATQYVTDLTPAKMVGWFLEFHFVAIPVLAVPGAAAAGWILARANRSMAATSLLVLWLAGVLSFLVQWRGFGYHLAPSMLALMACAAIAIDHALRSRRLLKAIAVVVLLGIGVRLAATYRALPAAAIAGEPGIHLGRFPAADDLTFADVASFVRRLHDAGSRDCVLLVGDASSINYLAQRRMPTRFYYYHVLEAAPAAAALAPGWLEQWRADLRDASCDLTLVSREAEANWLAGPSDAAAALRQFLTRYQPSGSIARGITIYTRR